MFYLVFVFKNQGSGKKLSITKAISLDTTSNKGK